jgi:hypothetical protein
VGVKKAFANILNWKQFQFCLVMVLKNQVDEFMWKLVVVYGSPYDDYKPEFIRELHMVMGEWSGPTMVGVTSTWLGTKLRRAMG